MAPILKSNITRSAILFIYAIMITLASYSVLQIEVYFSNRFFVSESSHVYDWFEANEKYFEQGGAPTITYVQNSHIDYREIDV